MPPLSAMLVVWTIACGDSLAEVFEDGSVASDDAALRDRIVGHLGEPVDVSHTGAGGRALVLQPTDRRYVVARVRKLVADTPDLEMVGVRITGQ
ncbi:MAG: hypothetical protein QOK05_451 [Chloroflexota bacterium]|jgi:hypothetical protein|nr:hypothetical protein [Chloroflexota bacterium]